MKRKEKEGKRRESRKINKLLKLTKASSTNKSTSLFSLSSSLSFSSSSLLFIVVVDQFHSPILLFLPFILTHLLSSPFFLPSLFSISSFSFSLLLSFSLSPFSSSLLPHHEERSGVARINYFFQERRE